MAMSTGLPEVCQERMRFLNNYRETAREYAAAVSAMADLDGAGLYTEVQVSRRSCRDAWEIAEKARIALFRHEADHQCDLESRPMSANVQNF